MLKKKNSVSNIAGAASCVLLLALAIGCKSSSNTVDERQVDFDAIEMECPVGIILDVKVKDNLMLVNQFSGETFLLWFSLEDGRLQKADISKGHGHREMIGPLKVSEWSDSLMIYDRQGQYLYKSDFQCDTLVKLTGELPFWISQLRALNNGNVVVSKMTFGVKETDAPEIANTRFALISGDSVLSHFGQYPCYSESDKKCTPTQASSFHQMSGFCELPNNRFAVSTSHVLSIYAANGDSYTLEKEIVVAPYEFEVPASSKNVFYSANLKKGYDIGYLRGLSYHDGLIILPFVAQKGETPVILCYDEGLNLVGKLTPEADLKYPFALDADGRIVGIIESEETTSLCISKSSVSELIKH